MFDEFIECTSDKDELETVTIVCSDCIMQVTLRELRNYINENDYDEIWYRGEDA